MKFIDEAIIHVKAGDGGNGCISFRREKYVPRGGPDGGDGGHGGHCIVRARTGLTTLMDVRYRKEFKADSGTNGMGKKMFGRRGEDAVIVVPVGTLIKDAASGKVLADMTKPDEEFIVAKGGRGGKGNARFATSTNQAPRKAEEGKPGEEKTIKLELKLLADVGLIGFPNAGKSTLISAISNARPKIADYPFTTKVPHLGVVELGDERSFVVADIPGLIEGAHQGAGMGIQFLKHIERTKVLLHLIDIHGPLHEDPLKAYKTLRAELKAFSPDLLHKPEIIVLTKMDISEVKGKAAKIGKEVFTVSAAKREGLKPLLEKVWSCLCQHT
ncbi:MAG: GTPase ObgE [Deltaproteobacteria bacterium]|nr:GTPase ObgE [Deltaproteobacteria bacterium]